MSVGLGSSVLPPGKCQQAVRQGGGTLRRALGALHVAFDLGESALIQALLHQLQAAGDPGEEIVEIMSQTTRQLTNGFHLLRLAQLLFQVQMVGDVPRAHHYPPQSPGLGGYRRRHRLDDRAVIGTLVPVGSAPIDTGFQVSVDFGRSLRGEQLVDGVANHGLPGFPVQQQQRGIGFLESKTAVGHFAEHRVTLGRVIEEGTDEGILGRQQRGSLLDPLLERLVQLFERRLSPPPLRHIDAFDENTGDVVRGVPQRLVDEIGVADIGRATGSRIHLVPAFGGNEWPPG